MNDLQPTTGVLEPPGATQTPAPAPPRTCAICEPCCMAIRNGDWPLESCTAMSLNCAARLPVWPT